MNQASIMEIRLNGEPHALSGRVTVAELLAALGHTGKRVAVERNGEIVPRSRHDATVLQPDDRIEIVVAVGGG
jgi:sulfur carrier protein